MSFIVAGLVGKSGYSATPIPFVWPLCISGKRQKNTIL